MRLVVMHLSCTRKELSITACLFLDSGVLCVRVLAGQPLPGKAAHRASCAGSGIVDTYACVCVCTGSLDAPVPCKTLLHLALRAMCLPCSAMAELAASSYFSKLSEALLAPFSPVSGLFA